MPLVPLIPVGFAVASPWLAAAGVLLAGIPILIHLLRRQRRRTQDWGAMQFVRRAARRRSRRMRIEALLLLAVRTLIILFVAIGLSRPYVEAIGSGPADETAVQHVVVIDTSASMGYAAGGESRFERAIEEAGRVVESARIGDAFHLLRIGGAEPVAVIRRAAYDAADVRSELARLQLSAGRGRPLESLEAVAALLADDLDVPRREVYLLTDLQATNWPLESPVELSRVRESLAAISGSARVSIIDIADDDAENAAVIDVDSALRLKASRMTGVVTATLRNFARTRRPGEQVSLLINGQIHETRPVDLPPEMEQSISFDVPVSPDADAVVEVRLNADGLAVDDSRWLVLPPARDDRVLLVDGESTSASSLRDASGFLRLALQPDAAVSSPSESGRRPIMLPTVVSDGMLADVRLDDFDCVYLCNVALLTEREVNLLEQFVMRGGGLVVVMGEAVRSANYNELMYRDGRRLLPARLLGATGDLAASRGGFRFEVDDYSHPILAPFEGNETAGLLTTRIDRYFQTEPDSDPATRVVLRYTSGDAAILERAAGDGRVILVTTALNDHWGNWALWPSFVPMMHELTRYASAGDSGRRERLVGEQIVRRVPAEVLDPAAVVLESAAGPLGLRVHPSDSGLEVVSPTLRTPGPYQLRIEGPQARTEGYVVNIDPAESDLARLTPEALEGLFPPRSELRYLRSWQPVSAEDTAQNVSRNSLSVWFLMAACCLLLVEQLMAWRFVPGVVALGLAVLAALLGQLTGSLILACVAAGIAFCGVLILWGLFGRRFGSTGRVGGTRSG